MKINRLIQLLSMLILYGGGLLTSVAQTEQMQLAAKGVSRTNVSYTTVKLSRYQKLELTNGTAINRSSTGVVQVIEMNAVVSASHKNAKILKDSSNNIWIETNGRKIKKGTFSRITSKLKTQNKTLSKKSGSNLSYKTIKLSPTQKLLLTNGIAIIRTARGVVEVIEIHGRSGKKYKNVKILKDNKNNTWIETNGRKLKKGKFLRITNKQPSIKRKTFSMSTEKNPGTVNRLGSNVLTPSVFPKPATIDPNPGGYQDPRPDLKVTGIRLVKDFRWGDICKIQITIANVGATGLPLTYYDIPNAVFVQMFKDDEGFGGHILSYRADRYQKLRTAGASVTAEWPNRSLNPGTTHIFKLVVDYYEVLDEPNERNNTATRRLECPSSKPLIK